MSLGTMCTLKVLPHHRSHIVSSEVFRASTSWIVHSFDLEHDAEEPKGFMVGTTFGAGDDDRLLFIPDTALVENRFEGVTIIAVECNFQSEILTNNILRGALPSVVGRRVRRSHFSLENVIAFLRANDLSRCRKLFLMHLSDGNSDERRMREAVQAATGIPVEVC
jgi:phosphoribosyl 1,2-cyclic phosphodiesterase